ncbi:CDP-glycerol glycerophosphotransferase family protein [Terrilactibacillus laevilacticus]|uniref:CDP-glycerol glycerophosphotransferase family protein n=1 Tax=Terrilactibacillus laevilacticus TaxID=1380157 RepID=UPI00114660A7|nr:CDP-glycerol glycerophosphotransferase family protein [Terrilactibacillus laevilacticus]
MRKIDVTSIQMNEEKIIITVENMEKQKLSSVKFGFHQNNKFLYECDVPFRVEGHTMIFEFELVYLNDFYQGLPYDINDFGCCIILNGRIYDLMVFRKDIVNQVNYMKEDYTYTYIQSMYVFYIKENRLTLVAGDPLEIIKTLGNHMTNKIIPNRIRFNHGHIIFQFNQLSLAKYQVNFRLTDKKEGNTQRLAAEIMDQNEISLSIDRIRWRQHAEYDLYIEISYGFSLTSLHIISPMFYGFTPNGLIKTSKTNLEMTEYVLLQPKKFQQRVRNLGVDTEYLTMKEGKLLLHLQKRIISDGLIRLFLIKGDKHLLMPDDCYVIQNKQIQLNLKELALFFKNYHCEDQRWKLYINYKKGTSNKFRPIIFSFMIDTFKSNESHSISIENYTFTCKKDHANHIYILLEDQKKRRDQGNHLYKIKSHCVIKDINYDETTQMLSFTLPRKYFEVNTQLKLRIKQRQSNKRLTYDFYKEPFSPTLDKIVIDLSLFIQEKAVAASKWDLYLERINSDLNIIEVSRLGAYDQIIKPKHKRYFPPIKTSTNYVFAPYLTMNNGLSFVIKEPLHLSNEKLKTEMKVNRFTVHNGILYGKVTVDFPEVNQFELKEVLLTHRMLGDRNQILIPAQLKKKKKNYVLTFSMDLKDLELEKYYWDIYCLVVIDGDKYYVRLKNPSRKVTRKLNRSSLKRAYVYPSNCFVYPYVTQINTVALVFKTKEFYETSLMFFKENLAYYLYMLFKWYFDKKDVWLAFEKFSEGAQDNGYYFFRYCFQNKRHKHFYYIIKKDSPDYPNLKDMKQKVIHFMSFKYMIYLYAAKLLISSESKGHVYDIRIQKGRLKKAITNKRHVFLQHGVISLKKVDKVFNKKGNNASDLFVVSSDLEKEIIKDHFGYDENEIIVTGLSRWDVMQDKSKDEKAILLMPTWRSWMDDMPEDKFIETDYYQHYVTLLNGSNLEQILEKYHLHLNFYIHPKFKSYLHQFTTNSQRINIIQYGEVKVNELLMRSALLITDYSSVAWDMYYQKKPIVFFQFDLKDYNKYQGSYMDMEKDLFGDRVFNTNELVHVIQEYAERHFKEKEQFSHLREKYFKYTDKNNAKRIFESIVENREKMIKKNHEKSFQYRILHSAKLKRLWRLSRANREVYQISKKLKEKAKRKKG